MTGPLNSAPTPAWGNEDMPKKIPGECPRCGTACRHYYCTPCRNHFNERNRAKYQSDPTLREKCRQRYQLNKTYSALAKAL